MKLKCTLFLALFTILIPSRPLLAGAWGQDPGDGYAKLYYSRLSFDSLHHPTTSQEFSPTTLTSWTLYSEIGVFPDLTGVLSFPLYKSASIEESSKSLDENGIGDADMGVKYTFLRAPIAGSLQTTVGIPIGESDGDVPLSDDEWNVEIRGLIGKSFPNLTIPIYAGGEAGFNVRTEGYSHEIRYLVESGFQFWRFILYFKLHGLHSFENTDEKISITDSAIFRSNNAEFLTLSSGFLLNVLKQSSYSFNLEASTDSTFYARYLPSGRPYFLGVSTTF